MDYTISLSKDHTYIIIKFHVPMNTEIALKAGPELIQKATKSNINKYLFDMRVSKNEQSVVNNYFFAYKDIQDFHFPKNSISAFLIHQGDNSHDFITTAFLNAGYVVAKFTSEKEAIVWLNGH